MILAYKKKYQTCLEMLEALRAEREDLREEKLSYNGILDPMAEGVVIVLVGDEENKNRDSFTGSIKEYEVGVLVGVSTDSGDLLGIVDLESSRLTQTVSEDRIVRSFLEFPRQFDQTVPMHSNRKVRGKRLWWWILNGTIIPEEERPKNSVQIYEIEHLATEALPRTDLENEIQVMGSAIGERFRLPAVLDSWQKYFNLAENQNYLLLKFRLKVSSGFYVRVFVENVARQVGLPMVVLSLKRTKIHDPS